MTVEQVDPKVIQIKEIPVSKPDGLAGDSAPESEIPSEPSADGVPPHIERGKRGRGRPPKADKFVSELPVPVTGTFQRAAEFFKYIRSIPRDKAGRYEIWVYRYFPIIDATKQGTQPKTIDIILGEVDPFLETEDWEQVMLHRYGSGNYACYVCENSREICRCVNIKTRWDLVNYPPVIDPETLLESHPNNRDYVHYLKQRGVRLPSQKTEAEVENEMAMADTVSQLTSAVIGLSQRAATPVPPQPVRESPSEKLNAEAAAAAIGIVRKEAEGLLASRNNQTDPLAIIQGYVSLAQTMKGGDEGTKIMLDSLARRLESSEDRANKLMDRLLDMKSTVNPQVVAAPKTLIEQLRELREMKELMGDVLGIGGGGSDSDEKAGRGGFKELVVQNLPAILQSGLGIVDRIVSGATQITAVAKGQTIQEAAKTAEVQAAAVVPQVQQPQLIIPPGWDEQKVRRYFGAFGMIAPKLLKDFKQAVDGNTDPPVSGYDFAEWFIDSYNKVPAYTGLIADCRNADGTLNIEPVMTVIKQYPPIWNEISTVETEFRQFFTEFLTVEEADKEEAQASQAASSAIPIIPRTGVSLS